MAPASFHDFFSASAAVAGARDPSLLPTVAALAARRLQHPEPAGARPAAAPRDESADGRDGPAREGG